MIKLTKVTRVLRVVDEDDTKDFLDCVEEDSDSETVYVDNFRDLVRVLESEGVTSTSCSPATGSTSEWLESYPYQDPYTGDETTVSIHWDRSNPRHLEKYWRLAFVCLGLVH